MPKQPKSIAIDNELHKDITLFKKRTGIAMHLAMRRAWEFYKDSKEYATLILFKKEK